MGTGKEQAELWGPGARDWSDYNEPMCTPFYEAVLDTTGVRPGTALLDIGCGGGFALLLAARRGATVAGLDATPALLDIARERVPVRRSPSATSRTRCRSSRADSTLSPRSIRCSTPPIRSPRSRT